MALEDTLYKIAEEQTDEAYKGVLNAAADALSHLRRRLNRETKRAQKLDALEAAGVDNWEGYSEAMKILYKDNEEDE